MLRPSKLGGRGASPIVDHVESKSIQSESAAERPPGLATSVDGRSSPTRVAGQRWGCAVQGSPAAFAPLLQVRTLGAECRVLAVAGVDDGGVVVASEELGLDIAEQ